MIVAEIYVPVLDASYDFKLDENVPTGVVIEEIASVICQKEQCEIGGDKTQFMLFKVENRQSLSAILPCMKTVLPRVTVWYLCKICLFVRKMCRLSVFKLFQAQLNII